MPPRFPPDALAFLRGLKRHNDREWFRARKDVYETHVKAPMIALVEALDHDFRRFAPELVASPRTSLFRIYRDTRFSEDKSPYKTSVSAVFPVRGLPKVGGPGLYVELNPTAVFVAGGAYAPPPPDLLALRQHIAANLTRFRSLVEAPGFLRVTGGLQGDSLQRMPKGFAADHPAAELLRRKQFIVWREFPAALATTPRFYRTVLRVFEAAAPLVRFLSEPLLARVSRHARVTLADR
jgi:uncharacterized protein (TIGR02453 family)